MTLNIIFNLNHILDVNYLKIRILNNPQNKCDTSVTNNNKIYLYSQHRITKRIDNNKSKR